MRELPDELKIPSEAIEPTFAHMIGKWYAQTVYMKTKYGPHSMAYVDSMQNWWWGMESIARLLIACQGAVHAQVVIGNYRRDVKSMIEKELDIKFSFLDKDVNFRGLVKFELILSV